MVRVLAIALAVLVVAAVGIYYAILEAIDTDPFFGLYDENCSVCHGENLEGTPQGMPLMGVDLKHGESVAEISQSIAGGFPEKGMPAWSQTLNEAQIQSLAIYVAERRVGRMFTDFKVDKVLAIPEEPIESELLSFRLETIVDDLDPLVFSIAPLPDGSILVSEKQYGLRIVSPDGEKSELIEGTPDTSSLGIEILNLEYGIGWMLDVAIHPDYEENGWIYLHHGHLCETCGDDGGESMIPMTMNRLVRARISDGKWVDQEVIWQAATETYTPVPEIGAGGRTAFDPDGYVFLSVGIKGDYFKGIQDLSLPYGKIHRVHDDGRIPADNPFVDMAGAMPSIWTYGHRSPQGLEFNLETNQLWGTEMGPRGGDEVNLLLPGRNYGWPLYSKGVDYDGTPVEYGKDLGIEFDLADIEQPVVDLTPSPAVSSFVFYQGDLFPEWRSNIIVGTLKATELYRIVLEDNKAIHQEILIKDLARIRDVETGPHGAVYLLLEHDSGSRIVRLVPERA